MTSIRGTRISVMLAVADAPAAAAWYAHALGATELWNLGSVIGLSVDGAPFFLHEPTRQGFMPPAELGRTCARVEVFSDNPDAFVERAIAAGATGSPEIEDHNFSGGVHRQGGFTDPFGHVWLVGDKSPLQVGLPPANRSMPESAVIPVLAYQDVTAAIDWLCSVFGMTERWRVDNHRAQLRCGNGTVVVRELGGGTVRYEPADTDWAPVTHSLLVQVQNADEHYQRALRHGAQIVRPPEDFPYGERQYTVTDMGGHSWTFSQSIADVLPEDWGGTSADLS